MRMEQTQRGAALRRMLCAMLALALVWTLLPASAATTYGVVTGDRVLFRKATTGSDYWDHLNTGWVARVIETVTDKDYTWYKVETNITVALNRSYVGFIRGDFFRMLTEVEEAAWLVSKPQPDPALGGVGTYVPPVIDTPPTVPQGDFGLVTLEGANLRQAPDGTSITALKKDELVEIMTSQLVGTVRWYQVKTSAHTGYLTEDQLKLLTPTELAEYLTGVPATPGTAATSGTLRITKTSTNLRKEPGGTSLWQYAIGTELPFTGAPVFVGGYYWAKVTDSRRGLTGYVRSDCYEVLSGGTTQPVITAAPPTTAGGTVRITLGNTNLRQAPGGTILGRLSRGVILPFYGSQSAYGGYNWVYVYDEVSQNYGYVRSDCYEFVTGAPTVETPEVPSAPGTVVGSLTLIKGGVNLRNAPAGDSFAQLPNGTTMNYTSYVQQAGYTWYKVDSPKGVGYVRSDCVKLNGEPTGPVVTPPTTSSGYLVTVKSAINLRQTASPKGAVVGTVDRAQVMPITGVIQSANGYNWFPVNINGTFGYLRGDCVRQLSNQEVSDWINHNKMPSLTQSDMTSNTPVATGYVVTIMDTVNIRSAPSLDSSALGQAALSGTAFPLLGTQTSGGRLWYKVSYNSQDAYLLGSVARMMTNQEYLAYLAGQPTPGPTAAPTPVPPLSEMSLTAITNIESVIIRSAPGITNRNLAIIYRKGSVVALRGETATVGSETWYAVRVSGINGWIRGDLLRVLTKLEEAAFNAVGDPDAPTQASYRSLSLGDSGEDVTRVQTELNRRGLLQSAYITGVYNNETVIAVKAFQRANGLVEDGIAGTNTQHKLFNTVPQGTYDPDGGGTVTPTLYPVEKVDWYTGDINTFWGRGEVAIMTDVTTGISLRIKRWAGGYHVDGEPLTSADTIALNRVYGVKSSQEILERNLYQRRAVWITLKGRTFAASLYGVPHNYPAGDTIPGNDFNGQLCVHFFNSRLHTSGTVDKDHMRAIQTAYDKAPSRK